MRRFSLKNRGSGRKKKKYLSVSKAAIAKYIINYSSFEDHLIDRIHIFRPSLDFFAGLNFAASAADALNIFVFGGRCQRPAVSSNFP